jgi:DNA-binding NtrC family response regulator
VAATSRDLEPMIASGQFRADLYYRLRYLRVSIPPLRERGDDWELIARSYLRQIGERNGSHKSLSEDALTRLRTYPWPGNVREVKSLVETGYHLSRGQEITLADLGEALTVQAGMERAGAGRGRRSPEELCAMLAGGEETFWDLVHGPFLDRELNRETVRDLISLGLASSRGSYKKMVELFGIDAADYLKFMDFLRHHRLKPER